MKANQLEINARKAFVKWWNKQHPDRPKKIVDNGERIEDNVVNENNKSTG